jgi:glycosyltransferase involved in cell wall biosynthesis
MWEPDPPLVSPPVSPALSQETSPLVSIVTPCLNSARFIEETIESVLAQDYPRIQHIVMDGGSTDGTIDILRRYESRGPSGRGITWTSEKDGGAADAINRGFAQSHGEIFAYLNADDAYLPGAVAAAVRAFQANPGADVVYGGGDWIDEEGRRIGPYPVRDFDRTLLARECFICQPASFIRRAAFENAGGLDPDLHLTFDYELWMRLASIHPMHRMDRAEALAVSRMHTSNKSLGQRREVFRETFRILRKHYGYVPFQWVYAYLCYREDGRDQFFEPFQPSVARYLESLPAGLLMNRSAMWKYFSEWFRVMSWGGLLRRIGART